MFEVPFSRRSVQKNEMEALKMEVENLRVKVSKSMEVDKEKESLQKKLEGKERKLESMEVLRDKLEKELAGNIAETTALKRTLDLERKERTQLEKKALDLIKGAKQKWELTEKSKIDALTLHIDEQKLQIEELKNANKTLKERLDHSLKVEEKNRESIETVQNLSRRSVVGLENRLEKMTSEAHNTMAELQGKLSEEIHKRAVLQNKVKTLNEKEQDLKEKLKSYENNYECLKSHVDEAEAVITTLSNKVTELEKDLGQMDQYKDQLTTLQNQFEDSQKSIKDLQNKNVLLKKECVVLEAYKKEMDQMKKTILKMQKENTSCELEKELEKQKEECLSLKRRLEVAENSVTKSQELKEKQMQFWKMEKELSNCKIDKRILERELKEAQIDIKLLNEKLAEAERIHTDYNKSQEKALLEISNINENISLELVKCKENNKMLQEQLKNEKNRIDDEQILIKELKKIIITKEDKIKILERQIGAIKEDNASLDRKCEKEELERLKLMELLEQSQKEKGRLVDEIESQKREINNAKLNLSALREACTLLEGQVIEYEKIVEACQLKESQLNDNTEKLISELSKARQETQEANRLKNELKSLIAMTEQKVKRLQEDLECLEKECQDYKQQCMDYKKFSSELSEDLNGAEEKLGNTEATIKTQERQIEKLSSENRLLKEELSDSLTKISNLKDSLYKTGHQLNDCKENNAVLVQKTRELERILHETTSYHKERELKTDATIKQQIKLIDYLQTKVDELNHKKRTFTEVIFGSSKKENQPPLSLVLNYKDLEAELSKEKENNRLLKEEVVKLKASTLKELNYDIMDKFGKMEKSKSSTLTPRSKEAVGKIVKTPNSQDDDVKKQNSVQRMHHNIPHRFESKMCTSSQKCAQCNNQIVIGRNYHICKECKAVAHTVCSASLPKACGLPKEFAVQFKETMKKSKSHKEEENELTVAVCEGWIKMPCVKSNSWEKRYAHLTERSLDIYDRLPKEAGSTHLESFPLKSETSHGKIILEPLESEIGIPVATSDLPFVMKVEVLPESTCWPSQCLILMALSAKEKDTWFKALQKSLGGGELTDKLETIVKLPANLAFSCVVDLTENIKVLGSEKGLYSYYDNKLLPIEGVDKIEHMAVFTPANLVLFIAGPKSCLISCDLNHLINLTQCSSCTKPTLKYKEVNVNDLNGFHILQVSKHSSQQKIAVATSKQLLIIEYIYDKNEFVPVRILDTAQPISCLLFTSHSLIVGADKFFEIDLNSFVAEEFLDSSDTQLTEALKCFKIKSFPIGIMQMSSAPKEYLLSFNEFSVFVDEYGRSSRKKGLVNQHLPLAIHLAKNYLYTVQFSAVEVIKITDEVCNVEAPLEPYRLSLPKIKYLGSNSMGIYIEQEGKLKFLNARILPDFDAVSLGSGTTENDDSRDSRFSFTSSMVQSLDGNLSGDSEEQFETMKKTVKFVESDF